MDSRARPPLQNRLPWPSSLWHQSGMAKQKKNSAAVALGRLGGLKGGKATSQDGEEEVWSAEPITITDGSCIKVYPVGAGACIWEAA